jgi:hypothetical protein
LAKVRFELEAQASDPQVTTRLSKDVPVKATFYKSLVGVR